MFFVNVV